MSDTSNSKNSSQRKVNWSKKGLGWIPDYPDLRDLELNRDDIKLQREGVTTEVEELSSGLIKLARLLSSNQDLELPIEEIEQHISDLEGRVFGGVKFANVRVHRLLRDSLDEDSVSLLKGKSRGQGDRSKQILSLKNYLSILATRKYLKLPESIVQEFLRDIATKVNYKLFDEDADQVDDLLDWLRKDEFDATTKFLVMLFQYCTGILVDGIVGLETYTTLNEYFSESNKLSKLPKEITDLEKWLEQEKLRGESEAAKKGFEDSAGSSKQLISRINRFTAMSPRVKTRLISIPSVVSTSVFEVILAHLKKSAAERVKDELNRETDREKQSNIVFERRFLKIIYIESEVFSAFAGEIFERHFSSPQQTLMQYGGERVSDKQAQSFIDSCVEDCGLGNVESFTEIFYSEFFIVEPLVSAICKLIAPLACWGNQPIERVVDRVFVVIRQILNPATQPSDLEKLRNDRSLFHTVSLEEIKELVLKAIEKIVQLFESGIGSVIDEQLSPDSEPQEKSKKVLELLQTKDSNFARTVCFYFLVKKFVNCFFDEPKQIDLIRYKQPSIFDKQELFELENLFNRPNSSALQEASTKLELFPGLKLQIPVSGYLIKSFEKRRQIESCANDRFYVFLPGVVDLSYWCSPVEDQGSLNACTAFAGVALVEYFANRRRGRYMDLSPLFLYKTARTLMSLTGDVGASVRESMRAMALFGVPPEQFWSYDESCVDEEPPPFCYSYAQNFQALKYFRLDYAGMSQELLLSQIKATLAAGFPCIFGFTIYTSAYEETIADRGFIPFPNADKDRVVGGHAVIAVGYDDFQEIQSADQTTRTRGALLIQNSWGREWGRNGYGWIPYEYVLRGLTRDWWSLLKSEWLDDDSVGLGARSTNSGEEEGGNFVGSNRGPR